MTKLKIASFNTWNNLKKDGSFRASILSKIIEKEKIDIIGLQEVTYVYENSLMESMNGYSIFGDYRFSKIFRHMIFNESNSVVTNREVIFAKTYKMPFIPNNFRDLNESTNLTRWSLLPRIATVVLINIDGDTICVINTHLDYKFKSVKCRQLNYLEKIIKEYKKYKIVLMGDFNIVESDKDFVNFIQRLDLLNLHKIKLDKSTFGRGKNKKIIDHVFVSGDINVLKCSVVDNKEIVNISDHNMIILNIEIK